MMENNSSGEVHIRPMTLDDLDAVVAIDQLSFSLPWPSRSFRFELQENPASRSWVAEDSAGHILAMTVIWLIEDEAHIATFAVHPGHRGRGIGRLLLEETLAECSRVGMQMATLEVRAGNVVAQGLYRSYGFEEVARRPHYYADNQEDAIIMTTALKAVHSR